VGWFDKYKLDRKTLGIAAVCLDLLYMAMFLGMIWVVKYLVKVDSERHKNLLFETSEFSIQVKNLPHLDENYSIELLKSELWDHITSVVKE